TEGPKVAIGDIQFSGNSFASSAVLKTHLQASSGLLGLGVFGSTYNATMLDYDQNELLRYYRSFGYQDVRIGRELSYATDARKVTVIFHVNEGIRYKLADTPQVTGVKSEKPEALEANNKAKAGEYYNQATIDGDLSRIRDWMGCQGRETRA